ncbi:MAG TPA: GAF domain-containing sensor histidine kinase [Herpetosiphonaceae bacterium]
MTDRKSNERSAVAALSALAAMSATPFESLPQLADAYLRLIMRQLGMRSAFVSEFVESAQRILHSRDNDGCDVEEGALVPLEDTFCQFVRATSLPVTIPDSSTDARVNHIVTRRNLNIGAYAGVPILLSDGSIYGSLCALDPEPKEILPAHMDLLRIAANHLGFWVERERAYLAAQDDHQHARRQIALTMLALDQQINVLHMVAHDLRTPLSGVIGFADLLQEGVFEPLNEEQHRMLDHIKRAGVFANRLVTDIVDAASAERPALRLMLSAIAPQDLAAHVLQMCQPKAAAKDLELRQETEAPPASIETDAERLQQVLYNLLSNAIHYTDAGSVTLLIRACPEGVEFQVRDTGPGIPPERQAEIWEMYARATTKGGGLGVGLAVVKNLVQALGGTTGLESQVGAGSTFWVRLPLRAPSLETITL